MQKKKKFTVAIVANSCWNIKNFRQPIIRMLEDKDAEIYVLAPFDFSCLTETVKLKNFIGLKYGKNHHNGLYEGRQSVLEFKRIFKKIRPDLVMLYTIKINIFGNIAAAQMNIPVISTVTGLGFTFLKGGLTRLLTQLLYKIAFRKTKHIVFHNPDDLQLFVDKKLADEKYCKVIRGSGVNVEKFIPYAPAADKDKFIFIFVGRLLKDKGIQEFMAAAKYFEKNRNIEFHIVGDRYDDNPATVSERYWLETCGSAKNVVWHENQNDVRPFIAAADVMVLPSYREGLPMSVLEAMAMGKPIITTDVPGCRETVEQGVNGFLIPVRNENALIKAMHSFYEMPFAERKKRGENSRKKAVKEFSADKVATAYQKLIFKEKLVHHSDNLK